MCMRRTLCRSAYFNCKMNDIVGCPVAQRAPNVQTLRPYRGSPKIILIKQMNDIAKVKQNVFKCLQCVFQGTVNNNKLFDSNIRTHHYKSFTMSESGF